MNPISVSNLDMAFPASVTRLMPPDTFERYRSGNWPKQWEPFVSQWFFRGADPKVLVPKEGVDKTSALRHIQCIMGSFEPKHEHKIAAVALLLDEWFTY